MPKIHKTRPLFFIEAIIITTFFMTLALFMLFPLPGKSAASAARLTAENASILRQMLDSNVDSEDFSVPTDVVNTEVEALFAPYAAKRIGMSYIDLTDGSHAGLNEDSVFVAASTIKVPLVMLVADLADKGQLDLDSEITYDPVDHEDGTGLLHNHNPRGSYKISYLCEIAIKYSDNIAKNMLFRMLGDADPEHHDEVIKMMYNRFLGTEPPASGNSITPRDAALFLQYLYQNRDKPDFAVIIENMKNTQFHNRLETPLTKGLIAHKIGSNAGYNNDIAIVEGDHPYVLTFYSYVDKNYLTDMASISNSVFNEEK
ncbi:MAG: class A beta-lactamase-related serine hydrolase [Lactobacillales bacterium]|jgi:beta-lactamase class A|nr:class A beta-lactamase-related serine hydrolase [Lactobacillales bacterium]